MSAGFKWQAGMLSLPDRHGRTWRMLGKPSVAGTVSAMLESGRRLRQAPPPPAELLPDTTDAPTCGAILQQLRDRYSLPALATAMVVDEGWGIGWLKGGDTWAWLLRPGHKTEGDALMFAVNKQEVSRG